MCFPPVPGLKTYLISGRRPGAPCGCWPDSQPGACAGPHTPPDLLARGGAAASAEPPPTHGRPDRTPGVSPGGDLHSLVVVYNPGRSPAQRRERVGVMAIEMRL